MSGAAPRSLPLQAIGSGMISPANSFVFPATGQLTGLSFRFLFDVFNAANSQLENIDAINADIATLQNQMATANGNIATLQGQVTNINATLGTMSGQISTLQINMTAVQSDITSLQGQVSTNTAAIATINQRLAAAGIP
jgi:hypothetical protein